VSTTHTILSTGNPEVTGVLTPNQVDTVTFPGPVAAVTIYNRFPESGEAPINVRVDGEAPVVGGEKWGVGEAKLPAAKCKLTIPTRRYSQPTVVKVISSGAAEYTVCEAPAQMSGVEVEYL
jgi:hypothetical protein